MSSIVIAGNTSGTVTITAPLVSGSTTLTLPATSGNVLTDTTTLTSNSLNAGLGVNQTWQSVTRTSGTTYTNNTGKPIVINAYAESITSGAVNITVGGLKVSSSAYNGTSGAIFASAIVPNNTSYVITDLVVTTTKIELR